MQKTKYLKRIIDIVMLLCLVVLGKFAMKAMVATDSVPEDNQIAAEQTEIEQNTVEADTQLDNGEVTVEKETGLFYLWFVL